MSDGKWTRALEGADKNKDGRIDLIEFKSIFKKMIEESRKTL